MARTPIPWGRLAAEFVVIVASILLAFGIDAWWEGVGEQQEEREALVALRSDFVGYSEALDSARAHNEARVGAARILLTATGPSPATPPNEAVRAAFAALGSFRPVRLRPGVIATLMEANARQLIRSSELRTELSEWTQSLVRLDERNRYIEEQSQALGTYLRPRYPFRSYNDRLEVGESRFSMPLTPLLQDQEFENLVVGRGQASLILLEDIEVLEGIAERVLLLIAAEERRVGPL